MTAIIERWFMCSEYLEIRGIISDGFMMPKADVYEPNAYGKDGRPVDVGVLSGWHLICIVTALQASIIMRSS